MASTADIRWKQRFSSFRKAFAQLRAAAELARQRPLSPLEQQGLIQAFEFTHELAWKTLKDFLESRGVTQPLHGSKDVAREAFATGLIDQGQVWMDMTQARNLSSHTYNERTAEKLTAAILADFVPAFESLGRALTAEAIREP